MDSEDPKICSKDLNKAVRIANVDDGGEISLRKSEDGKYKVKVKLIHVGSPFGPVIFKVKKNFDAQADASIAIALLKPNTKQSISLAFDALVGIKPNGKLRISWMEVPAKDVSSCDGKGSQDLLVAWKKLEQEGYSTAMRDIKLKILDAVIQNSVATNIRLVTLKQPGSSKEKSAIAQETVATASNSSEIVAEATPNESLEQLRLMKECEINASKYENAEPVAPKLNVLEISNELDTVVDASSVNKLPIDLSTVSVPEETHIEAIDSEKVQDSPKIQKFHEFDRREECKIDLESVATATDLHKNGAEHLPFAKNGQDPKEIIEDEIPKDVYDSLFSLCPIIAQDTSLEPVNDDLALEDTRRRIQEVRELIQNMGTMESETEGSSKDQCVPMEDDLKIPEIALTEENQGHEEQVEAGSLQDIIESLMDDENSKAEPSPSGDLQDEPGATSDSGENCVSYRTADPWDTNTLAQKLSERLIDPLNVIDQLSRVTQEASKESKVMDQKSSIERPQSKRIENLRKNIMFKDTVIEELKAKVESLEEEIQEMKTLQVADWNENTSSRCTQDASVQIDSPIERTSYDAVDFGVVKSTDTQNSSEFMESSSSLPLDVYGTSFPLQPPKCQVMQFRGRVPFVSTTSWNELRTSFEVDCLRGNRLHPSIHVRMIPAHEEMYRMEICIPAAAQYSADVISGSCFFQVTFLDLKGHPIASNHFFFGTKNGTCRNGPAELLTHSCQDITYTSPACINFEKLTSKVCPLMSESVERSMLVLNTEIKVALLMMSTRSSLEDGDNLFPTFDDRIKSLMRWSLSDTPPVMRKLIFRVGTEPAFDCAIGEHILADCSPVFSHILDGQMINFGSGDTVWSRLPQVLPRTICTFSDFLHGRCTHEDWQRNFQLNLDMLLFSMFFLIRELVTKCIWNFLDMHHGDFILEEVIRLVEIGKYCGLKCLVDRGMQWLRMESQMKSVGSSVMITSIPDEDKEQLSAPSESLLCTSASSTVSLKQTMSSKDDCNSENGEMSGGAIRSTSDGNSLHGNFEENSTGKQNRACRVCGADSDGFMFCITHWEQHKANAKGRRQCFKCEKVGHKYFECYAKKRF